MHLVAKRLLNAECLNLIKPGRVFLREGELVKSSVTGGFAGKKTQKRYFFLFSDLLIWTRPKRGKYDVRQGFALQRLTIVDLPDHEHSFRIDVFGGKEYRIQAKSENEKIAWLTSILSAQAELNRSRTLTPSGPVPRTRTLVMSGQVIEPPSPSSSTSPFVRTGRSDTGESSVSDDGSFVSDGGESSGRADDHDAASTTSGGSVRSNQGLNRGRASTEEPRDSRGSSVRTRKITAPEFSSVVQDAAAPELNASGTGPASSGRRSSRAFGGGRRDSGTSSVASYRGLEALRAHLLGDKSKSKSKSNEEEMDLDAGTGSSDVGGSPSASTSASASSSPSSSRDPSPAASNGTLGTTHLMPGGRVGDGTAGERLPASAIPRSSTFIPPPPNLSSAYSSEIGSELSSGIKAEVAAATKAAQAAQDAQAAVNGEVGPAESVSSPPPPVAVVEVGNEEDAPAPPPRRQQGKLQKPKPTGTVKGTSTPPRLRNSGESVRKQDLQQFREHLKPLLLAAKARRAEDISASLVKVIQWVRSADLNLDADELARQNTSLAKAAKVVLVMSRNSHARVDQAWSVLLGVITKFARFVAKT